MKNVLFTKRSDPKRSDPKQSDPKQSDPKRSDPKQSDPKRSDPKRSFSVCKRCSRIIYQINLVHFQNTNFVLNNRNNYYLMFHLRRIDLDRNRQHY